MCSQVNFAFKFELKGNEDGTRIYLYAHENNTVVEKFVFIILQIFVIFVKVLYVIQQLQHFVWGENMTIAS